jgi:hypothetical protein|eukprot:COSAG01_NODE_1268_length_10965_cov_17.529266_2_plen_163_part_00
MLVLAFSSVVVALPDHRVCMRAVTHTFTQTYATALADHSLEFAGLVKEFHESNVLPMPLGMIEYVLNAAMRKRMMRKIGTRRWLELGIGAELPSKVARAHLAASNSDLEDARDADTANAWGRHFTFPVTSLDQEIQRASMRFRTLRERDKMKKRLMMQATKG